MIALIQRVSEARVCVGELTVGRIERGLLALIGVERDDSETNAERLFDRLSSYRVFPDEDGKMNRSLIDIQGGLLLVPQFTLAADTRKGTRPSFSSAAAPEIAQRLFDHLLRVARGRLEIVHSGVFGADMQVHLINDGSVTFRLDA